MGFANGIPPILFRIERKNSISLLQKLFCRIFQAPSLPSTNSSDRGGGEHELFPHPLHDKTTFPTHLHTASTNQTDTRGTAPKWPTCSCWFRNLRSPRPPYEVPPPPPQAEQSISEVPTFQVCSPRYLTTRLSVSSSMRGEDV